MNSSVARTVRRALDGLLLLDKPSGMTSNAALQRTKWLFRARKAGHTGSLDPLASGMLPICFGEATKFAGYLLDADKTYRVQARLGIRTDTADAEGRVVDTHPRNTVSPSELEAAVAGLRGRIEQIPPMYSALKQQGQRLYALARAGQEVERAPRTVQIHEFVLEAFDPSTPVFRVRCSKGTYIRTLIEDLAARLGTLAHVTALRRLSVEPFGGEQMVTLDQLEAAATAGDQQALDGFLKPLVAVVPDWPAIRLDTASARLVACGGVVPAPLALPPGPVALFGPGDSFIGVGDLGADGRIAPRRLVAQDPAIVAGL